MQQPGALGNFEVVVPDGSDLVHDKLGSTINMDRGSIITGKATGAGSVIQGTYIQKPGTVGNSTGDQGYGDMKSRIGGHANENHQS